MEPEERDPKDDSINTHVPYFFYWTWPCWFPWRCQAREELGVVWQHCAVEGEAAKRRSSGWGTHSYDQVDFQIFQYLSVQGRNAGQSNRQIGSAVACGFTDKLATVRFRVPM